MKLQFRNFVNYSSVDDNDNSLFSLNLSNYRTLADTYNDKYEYILPEMTFDKQLFHLIMVMEILIQILKFTIMILISTKNFYK